MNNNDMPLWTELTKEEKADRIRKNTILREALRARYGSDFMGNLIKWHLDGRPELLNVIELCPKDEPAENAEND